MTCETCGRSAHRDDAMNRRCDGCEWLVNQCICEKIISDVHTAHCCPRCGCKYGKEDCTVKKGAPQEYPCESCEEDEKRAREQVVVIVDNTEHSIAAWLEKVADAHEARQREANSPGWSTEDVRAHHYRDAARGIRAGEWRK